MRMATRSARSFSAESLADMSEPPPPLSWLQLLTCTTLLIIANLQHTKADCTPAVVAQAEWDDSGVWPSSMGMNRFES